MSVRTFRVPDPGVGFTLLSSLLLAPGSGLCLFWSLCLYVSCVRCVRCIVHQFCLTGPVGHGTNGKSVEDFCGSLGNGGQYVLCVDVNFDGITGRTGFTFYRYEKELSVNEGSVVSET